MNFLFLSVDSAKGGLLENLMKKFNLISTLVIGHDNTKLVTALYGR